MFACRHVVFLASFLVAGHRHQDADRTGSSQYVFWVAVYTVRVIEYASSVIDYAFGKCCWKMGSLWASSRFQWSGSLGWSRRCKDPSTAASSSTTPSSPRRASVWTSACRGPSCDLCFGVQGVGGASGVEVVAAPGRARDFEECTVGDADQQDAENRWKGRKICWILGGGRHQARGSSSPL